MIKEQAKIRQLIRPSSVQVKDLVHVWEIRILDNSLICGALTGLTIAHSAHHATLMMMVDISKPEKLWNSLEDCISAFR